MWHLFISWIILDLYVVARKKFRKGWFKMYQASSEFFIHSSKFQSTNNKTLVYKEVSTAMLKVGWCYFFWPYLLLLDLACLVIWQTRLEMSPSQKYLAQMKVSFEDLLKQLSVALRRLKDAKLRVKAPKSTFTATKIEYLRHILTSGGLKPAA